MRALGAIPRRLLPDACTVRLRTPDGGLGPARPMRGVRFVRTQTISDDAHRSADAGAGTLFVDAVNTRGAFEVPAGARVEVRGRTYLVRESRALEDVWGGVHHWELVLA